MVKQVSSFQELLSTPFANGVNALCWPRALPGNYAEVVRLLGPGSGVVALDEDRLRSLNLTPYALLAVDNMLGDLSTLRDAGKDPVLNIVYGYEKDTDPICPTDVFSWHVDSAPIESDTWLCTYHGAPSEALDPADAMLKVNDPAIRARLLELYHQSNGIDPQVSLSARGRAKAEAFSSQLSGFEAWLSDNHYNLHYSARPGARPHSFGLFNLWRITVQHPGNLPDNPQVCSAISAEPSSAFSSQVSASPPCVHRAPVTNSPRLLLIS